MLTTAPQQPGNTFAVGAGTGANQFAAGNDSRVVGAAQTSKNLSDMASGATALANIGGVTSAQAAAAAPIQTVVGQTGTISLSVLTANGVAPIDSPVFTTLAGIGGASTNALTITPGASSSTVTTLALSGTGALQLNSTATFSVPAGTISSKFYTSPGSTYTQASGALVPAFKAFGNFTGPMGSSANAPFQFTIPSDTMDTTGNGAGGSPCLGVTREVGGTGTKGGRSGIRSVMNFYAAITGDTSPQQYTGIESWMSGNANVGGTGRGASSAGSLYGSNPQVTINSGATYWTLANALGEVDIAIVGSTQPVTLGGTVTTGDTLTVTFTSSSITGSPVSIIYTIGASNTLAMCAQGLAALINNQSALTAAGISSVGASVVLHLYWPMQNTVTPTVSVGGSATETMTLGAFVSGGSVDAKIGASFVRLSSDSTRGISATAALYFADQSGAPVSGQWTNGIVFGTAQGPGGQWPIMPTGTIVGTATQTAYGNSSRSGWLTSNYAGYGIDFSGVNFSAASGASLAMPGMSVDGFGVLNLSNMQIGPVTGGSKIDVSGSRGSAAINAGGGGGAGIATNNYFPGDLIFDAYGGQYIVATVNASTGAVTALTTIVAPYVHGTTPSNPVSTTGGSGAGLNLTITWSAATTLQLNPTGGALQCGSGCFSANGSVATSLTSLGPTGAHTTVQEWFTVTDASGTVRYIPAF
jgi:hypothetical protein